MGMTVKYVMDRVNTLQELDDKLNTAPKNVNTREELAKAVGENLTYDDILELTALVRSSIADYLNMEVKMWITRWLKDLFKTNRLSCDYCINRNCVSNNSICSVCIDNDKYEFDEEENHVDQT